MPFWKSGRRFFEIHRSKRQPIRERAWHREAFGARPEWHPPIGRYGTVLRSAARSDTKPYQPIYRKDFFTDLSGIYRMQALTTEEALNIFERGLYCAICSYPPRRSSMSALENQQNKDLNGR